MMRRLFISCALVAGALAFASPAAAQLGGMLNVNMPVSGVFMPHLPMDSSGKPFIDYHFVVQVPGTYQIDLVSSNTAVYDPYLIILQNGARVATNDDGGGGLNSRIARFFHPGHYTVRVTRFGSGPVSMPVAFTLSMTSSTGPMITPPVTHYAPLTESMARVLATQYYSTQSEWAGQYAMSITRMRLVPRGPNTAEVHIAYYFSCIRSHCRGGRSGQDQRVFYYQRYGNQWRVVRMGGHMSGHL